MIEPMSEETETEVEEFTDELSDETLDREQGGGKLCAHKCISACDSAPVTDR